MSTRFQQPAVLLIRIITDKPPVISWPRIRNFVASCVTSRRRWQQVFFATTPLCHIIYLLLFQSVTIATTLLWQSGGLTTEAKSSDRKGSLRTVSVSHTLSKKKNRHYYKTVLALFNVHNGIILIVNNSQIDVAKIIIFFKSTKKNDRILSILLII